MSDTAYLPDREREWGERVKLVLDALVPVLLTAVIISLILFRVDVLHRFDLASSQVQVTACQAVKESNDDLDALLAKQVEGGTPEAKQFVADLAADHKATYAKCLTDGTLRPSK